MAHEHFYQISCLYLHVPSSCSFPLCLTYEFGSHLEISVSHLENGKNAMANEKIFTRKVWRTKSESLMLVSGSAWSSWKTDISSSTMRVVTWAQAEKVKKPLKALSVPSSQFETLDIESLQRVQRVDKSLKKLLSYAQDAREMKTKGGSKYRYVIQKGVLYRDFKQVKGQTSNITKQVVVPCSWVHSGWTFSIQEDNRSNHNKFSLARFCRSYEICQKTVPKGKVTKVPLGEMPIMDVPFHRVAVNLIGPITPVSDNGNRYILTIVDFATKYPQAVVLPRIETERVAEALLDIFYRVGFQPKFWVTMVVNLLQISWRKSAGLKHSNNCSALHDKSVLLKFIRGCK